MFIFCVHFRGISEHNVLHTFCSLYVRYQALLIKVVRGLQGTTYITLTL